MAKSLFELLFSAYVMTGACVLVDQRQWPAIPTFIAATWFIALHLKTKTKTSSAGESSSSWIIPIHMSVTAKDFVPIGEEPIPESLNIWVPGSPQPKPTQKSAGIYSLGMPNPTKTDAKICRDLLGMPNPTKTLQSGAGV
jgi:hypothetical protein